MMKPKEEVVFLNTDEIAALLSALHYYRQKGREEEWERRSAEENYFYSRRYQTPGLDEDAARDLQVKLAKQLNLNPEPSLDDAFDDDNEEPDWDEVAAA